ncbi:MAG: major capsid protein [Deltaproteobacteria bacterium]|nr:MAG: major capsid protein [Deltaproteobacteria bacterium]RLC88372.1 MAG: major capsid protein [Chloroflexota bacterium]
MADSRQILADRIIFNECQKQHSLPNLLTADAPSMIAAHDGKKQTPATAPVVQINDLSKTHGNQVSVTIIHDLTEKPSMGLKKRNGYEEDITEATFKMKIDQYHKATKVPLMIEQQKVGFNRMKLGRPLLTTYHGNLTDEVALVHLAGDRGTDNSGDRIVPLASDADFQDIMVNQVTPPTFDRMFYCGDAGSIDGTTGAALTTTDLFTAADTRKFKEKIELMANPPQPVSLAATDKSPGTDPMYIALITPKMWSDFEASSTDFQRYVSNALKRTQGFNHPLFKGEMFMKDNIMFKKYLKPISWQAGDSVNVSNDDDAATVSSQTVPSGVTVNRGIILGGQALAMAYGSVLPGGMGNFKMDGELFDQKAWWRQWMDWISGLAKIRFKNNAGRMNDYGVCCFDACVSN